MNEEINIKQIILFIQKGWKTLVITMAISLVFAFVILQYLNPITFHTKINGTLVFDSEVSTKYGDFNIKYDQVNEMLELLNEDDFRQYIADHISASITLSDVNQISLIILSPYDFQLIYSDSEKMKVDQIHDQFLNMAEYYLNYRIQTVMLKQFALEHTLLTETQSNKIETTDTLIALLETELSQISNNSIAYSVISERIEYLRLLNIEDEFSLNKIKANLDNIQQSIEDTYSFETYLSSSNRNENLVMVKFNPDSQKFQTQQFNFKTLIPVTLIVGFFVGLYLILFIENWKKSN